MRLHEFLLELPDDASITEILTLLSTQGKVVHDHPVTLATDEEIDRAREMYAFPSEDDLEIDAGAHTSETDTGTWVQAWVWLPYEEDEEDD